MLIYDFGQNSIIRKTWGAIKTGNQKSAFIF